MSQVFKSCVIKPVCESCGSRTPGVHFFSCVLVDHDRLNEFLGPIPEGYAILDGELISLKDLAWPDVIEHFSFIADDIPKKE